MLTKQIHQGYSATLGCSAVLLVVALANSTALAVPIQFANVNLLNANLPISFTNNAGASGTLKGLSIPVTFNFTSQSGLSTTDHAATLTLNSLSTPTLTPAVVLVGAFVDQPITSATILSIIDNITGKNLLTMAFTGDLVGQTGGPNASLSGAQATGQTVSFTSDYGAFGVSDNSFNLGLATITPNPPGPPAPPATLSIGPGGFFNSFVANMNGQFSADFTPVPEPASVSMFAVGLLAVAAWARKGKRRRGGA